MRGMVDDELSDEAIDWLVRLHSGRATAEDRSAFAAWRRRSPAHDAAAREAESLWQDIGRTPVAAEFGATKARLRPPAHAMTRRAALAGTMAASAAALIVASGALGPIPGLFADYATGVGERRQVRLPDGSIAYLNTASALSVAYGEGERRLSLGAGEALFDVAKDPARPFIVSAAGGEARALGTVFGVRRGAGDVRVVVSEGSVEVRLDGSARSSIRLSAGQGVTYDAQRLSEARFVDVGAATAWQRGKLLFNRRALADVAAELERYRLGRIVIADARLRDMPVTGVFELDDPEGMLRTIEQTLPVKVWRMPFVTVLR
jgi:transmembrane sensor